MPAKKYDKFMQEALLVAEKAAGCGEIPVGAVVVENDKIIGRGHNRQSLDSDPTAHAEIVALRQAAGGKSNFRLDGAFLYVSVKPCPMCSEAIKRARIKKVYYAAPPARESTHNTAFEKAEGFDQKSLKILRGFFKQRR